jgi:hypothetical protein
MFNLKIKDNGGQWAEKHRSKLHFQIISLDTAAT